jgi:anaerobic selenocysteine-containing dehydrogenase
VASSPSGVLVPGELPAPIVDEDEAAIDAEATDVIEAADAADAGADAVEASAEAVGADASADQAEPIDPELLAELDQAEGAAAQPELVAFSAAPAVVSPAVDSYSFRLVATRKLYDQGTIVQSGNHLAGLAPGTSVRVSPYDFDRLGVEAGGTVSVRSPRTTMMMPIHADAGVPRGTAAVVVNQSDHQVSNLMTITDLVTELRIETTK